MKQIKHLAFSIILSAFCFSGYALQNDSYEISITIKGNENSFLTIGFHLGNKQYIKDTIPTDETGMGVYAGNEKLEQGLYIVLLPDKRYFDIIVDDDQHFSLSCSKDDIVGSMHIEGSDENLNFIEYQRKWIVLQSDARKLRTRLQANRESKDSLKILREETIKHEGIMVDFLKTTAETKPDSFLSLLVKALIPISVPDIVIPESSSNPDSLRWVREFNYNKYHFFDNVDLSDSRLIRTPILYGKLESYFSRMVIQHPDSIMKRIPEIVEQTRSDSAMFRYMVVYLFNHFRNSTIMGHDGVVVKIIDDYYLSGEADWITEETFHSLKDDADRLRPSLIGKKGVNFIMETYSGMHKSLYDINSEYTIIYFWEPNCGHCKTSTPMLKELFNKVQGTGIEIFAVCTQGNKEEWKDYIVKHELSWINGWDPDRLTHYDFFYNVTATPLIYILDRDKNIIAKKIGVESIEGIIADHRRRNN